MHKNHQPSRARNFFLKFLEKTFYNYALYVHVLTGVVYCTYSQEIEKGNTRTNTNNNPSGDHKPQNAKPHSPARESVSNI
jgi:hypothetical protein